MRIKLALLSISSPKLEQKPYSGTCGLYSAVLPSEDSKLILSKLAKALGYTVDPEKFHCTVMYSKDTWPKQCSCNPNRVFRGTISKVQYWGGHDDKGYLSAAIKCPELHEEHERLKRVGCTPSFDVYTPHVTLWSGVEFNDELHNKINAINTMLESPSVEFSNQFVGDLKDD